MFAAYASKGDDENSVSEKIQAKEDQKDNKDWLSNSSFTVKPSVISKFQGTSSQHQKQLPIEVITISQTPPGSPSSSSSSTSRFEAATPEGSPAHASALKSGSDSDSTCDDLVRASSDRDAKVTVESDKRKQRQSRSRSSSRSRTKSLERSKSAGRVRDRMYKDEERSTRRSRSKSKGSRKKSRSRSRERASRRKHKKSERGKRRRSRSDDSNSSLENCDTSSKYRSDIRSKEMPEMKSQTFYEDKSRAFGNLNVETLSRPAVALYHCSKRKSLGLSRHIVPVSKKKTLKHRYYNKILKTIESDLTNARISKDNDQKNIQNLGQIQGNVEDELSKMTAKFNQDLAEDPQNIDLWKKYVELQDVVHQFERVYRHGGGASGARVTSERKLAILDKALQENPMCEELLRQRCLLAESVLPHDKLTTQLKAWIGKDPGNLVLWESLIMSTQGSLSTCKVLFVKSLYQEALTAIHNLKRSNTESVKSVESKLINLVLHLGLFFRQAGLFELMWSLINVYLEFNLAKLDPTKFQISSTIADNALTELEEVILGSQLPLPTLWQRVETLRAGTHWVPLPADADSEDPQRLVFPEDVNDLIHPINSPHLTFRLVTVTLTLLKVPILPWRETAVKAAGLHPLPWLLDGPEPLYASLFPLGTLEFKQTSSLLMDASQLACGPQYLIARPGQDEYIDFVTQVFSSCASCLKHPQQTFLLVWWLRFYRWLMQLERLGHCKLPKGRKKKMRSAAKDLLRQDTNRSNFLLFKEFALLELENGSMDGAKKVLQGAIAALPETKPVPIAQNRANICTLYRTYVEMLLSFPLESGQKNAESNDQPHQGLDAVNRSKALSLLVSLGRGTPLKEEKPSSTDIAAALSKFHHVGKEAMDKPSEEELDPFIAPDVSHLAPTFLVEWTACHGWLLFLSQSIWKAATMFENVLSDLTLHSSSSSQSSDDVAPSAHENFVQLQRESILEIYISLLRHHCHESRGSFGVLRDVLLRGLNEFPGNFTFSAALADLETNSSGTGLPLWRLSKYFYECNSAPAYALFVFVMRYRLKQLESAAHEARTLLNPGGPNLPDVNIKNRMSTILKKITKHPVMRRCPLLWRLRLQFAAAVSSNDSECCSTFYLALEDCPWSKALYMDIVQFLPAQLAEVQDLLVEKELRLHVTPEELEILRVDS